MVISKLWVKKSTAQKTVTTKLIHDTNILEVLFIYKGFFYVFISKFKLVAQNNVINACIK